MSISPTSSQANRIAKHAARLAWLRDRPELLVTLPGANDDVDDARSLALDDVLKRMMNLGLYSSKNYKKTARWGLRLLVSELRGEKVAGSEYRWNKTQARS